MSELTRDQVFLSYAHEDLDTVCKIFDGLTKRKLNVWFDKGLAIEFGQNPTLMDLTIW